MVVVAAVAEEDDSAVVAEVDTVVAPTLHLSVDLEVTRAVATEEVVAATAVAVATVVTKSDHHRGVVAPGYAFQYDDNRWK